MRDVRRLDEGTIDRLFSGRMDPDDAPPGFATVAKLVNALAAPATASELERRAASVATAAAVVLAATPPLEAPSTVRSFAAAPAVPRRRFVKAKVASVSFAAMMLGTSGLAMAGVLPDPVQDVAHRIFSAVGIDVPTSSDARQPDAVVQPDGASQTTPDPGPAQVSLRPDDPDGAGSGNAGEVDRDGDSNDGNNGTGNDADNDANPDDGDNGTGNDDRIDEPKADRPDAPDKPKPDRPDRPDRPNPPDEPDDPKPDRPDKPNPDRPDPPDPPGDDGQDDGDNGGGNDSPDDGSGNDGNGDAGNNGNGNGPPA